MVRDSNGNLTLCLFWLCAFSVIPPWRLTLILWFAFFVFLRWIIPWSHVSRERKRVKKKMGENARNLKAASPSAVLLH